MFFQVEWLAKPAWELGAPWRAAGWYVGLVDMRRLFGFTAVGMVVMAAWRRHTRRVAEIEQAEDLRALQAVLDAAELKSNEPAELQGTLEPGVPDEVD